MRNVPAFLPIMAERIWRAFWQDSDRGPEDLLRRAQESLGNGDIPFALIAHEGDTFLRTVSVIASDLDERPELTPWLAALWVEEGVRERGVGAALVETATSAAFRAGRTRLYLVTSPRRRPFYEKRGWLWHEERVGPAGLTILFKNAG
ncbi:MAG TPA: GNAT family N-acetyltransferase [Microvirga sp.]|nr:GNAT family N-acetyltransferase [Microvirga sp.]